MRTDSIVKTGTIAGIVACLIGCAQQGAPAGGPVDEEPPKVIRAEPENYSVNFDGGRILIEFDEYLDMANFTQELVVSPPMEEKPIVKMRKKTLIIEFEEELKEDVTYTFNFGEGIKDLNEGNVLLNFEYVFSTGQFLDSLSIKGTLKNAFDLTVPETPIAVMLYNELNDSLPLLEIPYYIGRADKTGNFAVNNLRKGIYKLFVLKDGNNNFLFDLPNEKIAFLDTSIMVDADYFRKVLFESGKYDSSDLQPDTTAMDIDTTGMSPDSVRMVLDSLENAGPDFNSLFVDLYMFEEAKRNQFISDYTRDEREFMEILFDFPLTDSFSYDPVYPEYLGKDDIIPELGRKRDSLTFWTIDTTVASLDTIAVALAYTSVDTLENPVTVHDTLVFTFREKTTNRKAGEEKKTAPPISVKTVSNNGKQPMHGDLNFELERPVGSVDTSKIEMYLIPDTIEYRVPVDPFLDTSSIRRVKIDHNWKEEGTYRIVLYPGAIIDLYQGTNDTIDRKFNIKPIAEYGKLILELEAVTDTVIIQVFSGKNIVRSQTIYAAGIYEFKYLDPATYRVKFIHDWNNNGKWDSGKYMEKRQPEKVEFIPKEIKLRANWDHQVSYVMGTNNEPPTSAEPEPEEEEEEGPLY